MATPPLSALPAQCPACAGALVITRLQCSACGTEVSGAFAEPPARLVNLPEPHGSLLELFLRVRGNAKEMERELHLSYPTVRARLEEAFAAAGVARATTAPEAAQDAAQSAQQRRDVLAALERKEISVQDAARRLRELRAEGIERKPR